MKCGQNATFRRLLYVILSAVFLTIEHKHLTILVPFTYFYQYLLGNIDNSSRVQAFKYDTKIDHYVLAAIELNVLGCVLISHLLLFL